MPDPNPPPPPPPPDTPADLALDALWLRVLEAWDDDKPHAAALEYALRTEQLAILAARYRTFKGDPAKAERAQRRLDAIVLTATQRMLSMKSPPRTRVPLPMTLSAVGIFLFTLGFLLYVMWKR